MIKSQIVAFSENFAIGKDNQLLWHFSEDLKYFNEKTSGKILIMGRKTFDSLGKPLPKRFHIVISRAAKKSEHAQVIFVESIEQAYTEAEKLVASNAWPDEVMICGGAEIYKQTLADCDFLYLSRIPGQFEADAFYTQDFPKNFTKTSSIVSPITENLTYEIWSKNHILA